MSMCTLNQMNSEITPSQRNVHACMHACMRTYAMCAGVAHAADVAAAAVAAAVAAAAASLLLMNNRTQSRSPRALYQAF